MSDRLVAWLRYVGSSKPRKKKTAHYNSYIESVGFDDTHSFSPPTTGSTTGLGVDDDTGGLYR